MECNTKQDRYALVILDKGINTPLEYKIDQMASIGTRVIVPLQKTMRKGTIVGFKNDTSLQKVLCVEKVLPVEQTLSKSLFKLAQWMASYYATPIRKVLKTIIPSSIRNDTKEKKQLFIKRLISPKKLSTLAANIREKHPSQAKILDVLLKKPSGILLSELLELSKTSKSPILSLQKQKIIDVQFHQIDRSPLESMEFFPTKPKILNVDQKKALDNIAKQFGSHKTHLIHGITGSGKTEIYIQAIKAAREKNMGTILLVPEISLTFQTIERLKSRFSEKMGILHHRLSDGERFDIWNNINSGKINIVIGARSAIFSPIKNLGLIIVDEEHESSYKQTDEEPCYSARDVAIMRGKIENIPVVLGSATPSFESFYNAKKGKYQLTTIGVRATKASLPTIKVIDMKNEYSKAEGFLLFSDSLLDGIKKRAAIGEQTLLFLNKRGFNSFIICKSCSATIKCPHCSVSLTYHKKIHAMVCHLCSYSFSPPPKICPECKKGETLNFRGVGTEQVERALKAILPGLRTLRMDADTTKHKGSHDLIFKKFRSGKADVLIGTQMIAKGLHFPAVTLVGVLNSDSALNLPDFRASENVFQLIMQVSGRAGRSDLPGEVIIQTSLPKHPLFHFIKKHNYQAFFDEEIAAREMFSYPPFSNLVKITYAGKNEDDVKNFAKNFQKTLLKKLPSQYTIYPAIPSGYAKIKDFYRYKILVKGPRSLFLSKLLSDLRDKESTKSKVRILCDIDPHSIFS